MELALLLILLIAMLMLGVPVAFALLIASAATLLALDIPLAVSLQRTAAGISIFSLMAIPFFIFAGDLMYRSGIAGRLVNIAEASLGRARGGLGQVNIGASMLFGAVSGSAIANVSAMGSTISPLMEEKGYDRDYAANVNITAAIVGLLIPPSHNMIIYAAASGTGVSIGDLFLAGVIPGILTGGMLMVVAWLIACRRGYPAGVFPGWRPFLRAVVFALPGLLTAIIIIGGILSGIFTATESSAVAVLYTIMVGVLVYRTIGYAKFVESAIASVRITAMVLLIIGAASSFGYVLAILEVPTDLASLLTALTDNPILILLIVNVMLLVLGTFMDMSPLIVITTPIFLPIVGALGIDPVHFGVIMMLNLGIGLVTPPVGSVLFVGAAVSKIPVEQTIKTIWPFYLALIAALLLVTYIPLLSMALPNALK
ncbi:TRAP transporter large permease [Parasphingorhabdus halotolerans]|uniref:TRAP transporter large permease protein n=1 Tax=Parasphingorhabdus halotolerans TaxID=2725558 RepID=A0A6H2DPE9_9SPHN|nr:TRAP transporter large permease [Parasphingorhabdus halotolerans]QJB70260.1 TRAP transporter large permease [Parasphingorhabdus halotolerans]